MNPIRTATRLLQIAALACTLGCATRHQTPNLDPDPACTPSTSLAPMPEPVTSFAAASHHGWLYVLGGEDGEDKRPDLELLTPSAASALNTVAR